MSASISTLVAIINIIIAYIIAYHRVSSPTIAARGPVPGLWSVQCAAADGWSAVTGMPNASTKRAILSISVDYSP
jgi:hypothetical protein